MKNTITSIISILGISVGFMSVADASERDRGYYADKRIVKKVRHDEQRRWKYRQGESRRDRVYSYPEKRPRHIEKHHRYDRPHHKRRHAEKHIYKHKGRRFVEKHVYKHKGRRIVEKHVYHRAPRRVEKRVVHHYRPAPRHRVVEKMIVRDRHHHSNALPVIAGGIIGSAIGNDLGHGDPLSTFSGAIFGAMLGDALSHH